jgi:hypothetical protein
VDAEEAAAEVRAQYRTGAHNRRVAAEAENLLRAGATDDDTAEFLCTCGRDSCDEILLLRIVEYDVVRAKPYRFVIAPEHETAVDEVIHKDDEYWIVEVKRQFRLDAADADHSASIAD